MNKHHRVVWPSYIMIALVVWSSVVGIVGRANDPMWLGPLSEMRHTYDALGGFIALSAALVAYGIFRRHEWGRVFGISLAAVVLFLFVGTRVLAPVMTGGAAPIDLGWDSAVMGILSVVSAFTLWRQSFRGNA